MMMISKYNTTDCRRRRRQGRTASNLLMLLFICTHLIMSLPTVNAKGLFHKKKDDEHPAAAAKTSSDDTNTNNINSQEPPSRPPTIIEAEARTARELSRAVQKMTNELNTCNSRVDSIQGGFQDLYTAHLSNVDGLRKCKEGMLTAEEMAKLDSSLDKVNPALIEQARAKEDERLKQARMEELTTKHRQLIHQLEDQIQKLVSREKTWERTISELVARRDLLEQREGAWERTIGDLMGEIEIRAKRENWWEEIKMEMEGRIGALSHIAVKER